jgi:VWFA-related protein
MMSRHALAALFLLAAQQPQPSRPVFKANATMVEVDVVATDTSGRPVRGLGREDFEVLEDDTPVDIVTFSAIDAPDVPHAVVPAPQDRSGSSFASNDQTGDARLVLIVLDDVQVSFTAGRMAIAKSAARRAVERLGPADLAGVLTTSGRLGGQAEFTTDKSRLLAAIEQFTPRGEHETPAIASLPASAGPISTGERIEDRRTRSAMAGLTVAARALATIPHRRKGVLLISQGFPATLEEIIRDPKVNAAWESIREFMLTAQRSNVAVYTVDPCGLENDPGCTRTTRQNLRTIAETTGGFAVVNTNALEAGVDRMMAESGTYYLIGYQSPASPNDGRHHRITVRTRARDVEIRAREGYDSPTRTPKATTVTPLESLLRSAVQTPGLTMRVVAIPAPVAAPPSSTVVVGIELPTAVATRAGRTDFAIAAIDREGKTRSRVRFTTNFAGSQKTTSTWTRTGSRIDLAPGEYQIRVAAAGANGAQGSVFVEVSVPRFDTNVGVGGLSLGAATSIAMTDADRLRDVLSLIPLAAHELTRGHQVAAQLPIRVSSKAADNPLTIVASLVRDAGSGTLLDRTQTTGRDYAGAAGKIYRVALPVELEAGSYRLVVTTTLGQSKIERQLAFSISP